MMEQLGDRVHFLHLRNVKRETTDIRGSFYEAEHLGGDTDMVALVEAALKEEARRRRAGRADASIPFRPDHGQDILDDLGRRAQPGYTAPSLLAKRPEPVQVQALIPQFPFRLSTKLFWTGLPGPTNRSRTPGRTHEGG